MDQMIKLQLEEKINGHLIILCTFGVKFIHKFMLVLYVCNTNLDFVSAYEDPGSHQVQSVPLQPFCLIGQQEPAVLV